MNDIFGLGIESSCDETSAAIVKNGTEVLSLRINTQIELHLPFQGVVPELASRNHLQKINQILTDTLQDAAIDWHELDYIGVTNEPGLIGSLMVGLQTAKTLHLVTALPLIGVNHLIAHLHAPFLQYKNFSGADPSLRQKPFLGLLVSGGNTVLFLHHNPNQVQILGSTVDDAAGEAFDKAAKLLNLGYPGGPQIEKIAKQSSFAAGRSLAKLPLPAILKDKRRDEIRFSFSGIKTSLFRLVSQNQQSQHEPTFMADAAFALQFRISEILERNLRSAIERFMGDFHNDNLAKAIVFAGGVSANSFIRSRLEQLCGEYSLQLLTAPPILCTDNGAMVAALAHELFKSGKRDNLALDASSISTCFYTA